MSDHTLDRTEQLAIELHKFYRAAEKSVNRVKQIYRKGKKRNNPNLLLHDHGWSACGQRKFFRKRAELLIKRSDGQKLDGTLQEIERQFGARLLEITTHV